MCKACHSWTIKSVYDIRDSVMEGFIQEENKDTETRDKWTDKEKKNDVILIKKEPFFLIVGTKA